MALHENVNKPKTLCFTLILYLRYYASAPKLSYMKSLRIVSIRGIQNIKSKLEYRNLLNYYP